MQNPTVTMNTFYNVNKVNFKNITKEKLIEIYNQSKKINSLFLNKDFKNNKCDRYLRIMELIIASYRATNPMTNAYATTTPEEKFLLFAFGIDPTFEAAIIHASEDKTEDIRKKMREKFGIYDPNLIKIEKVIISKFLRKEKQEEIKQEIERRTFK